MKFLKLNKSKTIFLIAGLIILILLLKSFGVDKIINHFQVMSWRFIFIVSLFLFNNIFLTFSWKVIINYSIKWKDFYKLVLARIAGDATSSINALGAVAGEPIKAMFLKELIPFKIGLASVVLDRTIHTLANTLLILTGVFSSFFVLEIPLYISIIALIFLILCLFFMLMILKKQKDGFIEYILSIIPKNLVSKFMNDKRWEKVKDLDDEIGYIMSNRENLKSFFLSLTIRYISVLITGILEIYLMLLFIGVDISFIYAMFIYIFNLFMTSLIFFMPANLGTSEGAFTLVLKLFGYDPALGITLGIIQRLRRFVWAGIGMFILFYAGLIKKEVIGGNE